MPHYNYISRNILVSFLFFVFLSFSTSIISAQGEPDGLCCDPDGTNYNFINCFTSGCCGIYGDGIDGCVEDPDCTNYNPNDPCIIPISDGIPFIIIAGGVLAFFRLREKKELVAIEA